MAKDPTDLFIEHHLAQVKNKGPAGVSMTRPQIDVFNLCLLVQENEKAIEFLQSFGILQPNCWCVTCTKEMTLVKDSSKSDGFIFRCPACRKKQSLRSGTFLENAKLSLPQFILLVYFWSHQASNKQMASYLGLSNKTVIDWLNFIREIASWKLLTLSGKVGGPGKVVQIDESLIYRAKNNVGHALGRKQKWVVGFYEVETKVGFVRLLENRSAAELESLILQHVEPGSHIHTDCWSGYNGVSILPVSPPYVHSTVNHSRNFVDPDTGCHTNNVEAFWCAVKHKFKRMRGATLGHTSGYLDEFEYFKRFGPTEIDILVEL